MEHGEQLFESRKNMNMKPVIIYPLLFLATLVATVGLITTVEENPDVAIAFMLILGSVLALMGIKRLIDDSKIK